MRTFIALDFSPQVKEHIERFIRSLKKALPDAGISWTRMNQFHLTLAFLGDITEQQSSEISNFLGNLSLPETFTFSLGQVQVFPHWKSPRVIWLGLSYYSPLLPLKKEIDAFLESLALPVEKRPFVPHFTLGRVRRNLHLSRVSVLQSFQDIVLLREARFESLTFYESILHREGAEHIPLVRKQFSEIH